MLFKLFRKSSSDSRPRFEQDSALTEELERRIASIQYQPKRGFLKDQQQQKRNGRGGRDLSSIIPGDRS